MLRCGRFSIVMGGLALLAASFTLPAYGAGFGIFEHGSKAMGMAGAFTAQADDGSALFHNVAGIAFQKERSYTLGATLISLGDSEFQGADPFPGSGVTAQQKDAIVTPVHLYYIQPMSDQLTFGLGVMNPFGLVTEWDDPDNFEGRFLSTKADLKTYDVTANLGWQATPSFGIGVGVVARFAEVELQRRVAIINPFTFTPTEVAGVTLESDLDSGYGFTVGVLHKYNNSFQWGLSYRSAIEVDFGGEAKFNQISTGVPAFDAVVAGTLPSGGTPIETAIDFPEMASFGVGFALSPAAFFEVDVNWTGWSSFDSVRLDFLERDDFDDELPQEWEDVYNYRAGLRWNASNANQWRFGFVYDETPQPARGVSPLLPDADRLGYTLGWGHQGARASFDVAFMYLQFKDRETEDQRDNFNGEYMTNAYLLGFTLGF